jgi:hypothetical protein
MTKSKSKKGNETAGITLRVHIGPSDSVKNRQKCTHYDRQHSHGNCQHLINRKSTINSNNYIIDQLPQHNSRPTIKPITTASSPPILAKDTIASKRGNNARSSIYSRNSLSNSNNECQLLHTNFVNECPSEMSMQKKSSIASQHNQKHSHSAVTIATPLGVAAAAEGGLAAVTASENIPLANAINKPSRLSSNSFDTSLNATLACKECCQLCSNGKSNSIFFKTSQSTSNGGTSFPFSSKLMKFKREQKAAKTLAIVVGCFCLCWIGFFVILPIGVTLICSLFFLIYKFSFSMSEFFYLLTEAICQSCEIPKSVFKCFFWLGYCNSAMNPLIYALSSREFRR